MDAFAYLSYAVTGVLTAIIAEWWLRYCHKNQLVDVPNARSSHAAQTPRGGGIAIAVVALGVVASFGFLAEARHAIFLLLALFIAAVTGFLDDCNRLTGKKKLALSGLAIVPLLVPLFDTNVSLLFWRKAVEIPSWLWLTVLFLGLTWVINLTNFMDGINGLAVAEMLFFLGSVWLLAQLDMLQLPVMYSDLITYLFWIGLIFLPFNFPIARVFLGDVGSLSLGVFFAWTLTLLVMIQPDGLFVGLILFALFWVDATVTLLRRFLSGYSIFTAHRTHAYQQLANRMLRSHTKTTVLYTLINVFWLLPCAYLCLVVGFPSLVLLVAILPIIVGVLYCQAGVDYD